MYLIEKECSTVFEQETFLEIQPAILKSILQLEHLDISEFKLWNTIVKWAKSIKYCLFCVYFEIENANGKDLHAFLQEIDILAQIHFEYMTEDEKQEILKEGIITESDLVVKAGRNVRQKLAPVYLEENVEDFDSE